MPSSRSSFNCANAMAASRAVPKSLVRCFFLGVTPWTLILLLALLAAHAAVAVDASERQPLVGYLLEVLLPPRHEEEKGERTPVAAVL